MLLSVCLFNLAGYTWIFDYFEAANGKKISRQLDLKQYADEDLLEIKLPFQVPYLTDWPDYRREDGEIEINGKHYSYVKIKISQDTIYLKCLPNNSKDKLVAARQDIIKKMNDLPTDDEDSQTILKKAHFLFGFSQKIPAYLFESPQTSLTREYGLFLNGAMATFAAERLHPPSA